MPFDETNEMGSVAYENIPITRFLQKEGDSLVYVYDFGDNWRHIITLEEIQPAAADQAYPYCAEGTGATPPEDIGGPFGYHRFLEALQDKKHPDHAEVVEFLGDMTWDPAEFFRESINELLQEEDYGMFNLTDFFMDDMMGMGIGDEDELDFNPELKAAVDEIIDNQLNENDPPETGQAYQRLQKEGWSSEDARKLVGQCVLLEIFLAIERGQEFNQDRFRKNLAALPNEPREVWAV